MFWRCLGVWVQRGGSRQPGGGGVQGVYTGVGTPTLW